MKLDQTPRPTAPQMPQAEPTRDPQQAAGSANAGFSEAELRAAARVIEHQVRLATARYTPKRP